MDRAAPGADNAIVTLEPAGPEATRGAIGFRLTTDDAEAAHAALVAAGSATTGADIDRSVHPSKIPAPA